MTMAEPEIAEELPPEGEMSESAPGNEGLPADDQPVESTETPADDDAGAPRSKGVERRIGQLTRRYRQAERENKELLTRLEAIEARQGPEPEPERPTSHDFETPEEYEDALFEWRDSLQAHKADTVTESAPQDRTVADKLEADLDAFSEEHTDAMETVFEKDWPCSDATFEFITNSDKSAALAYHLASNVDLAKQVDALSPMLAARELVKIESELSGTVKPSVTQPPPPGTPVTPSGSSAITDPDKMSPKQWRAWREGDLAKRA